MIKAHFEFKLQDLWIGVFWKRSVEKWAKPAIGSFVDIREADRIDVWVCLIPCVPLHIVWRGPDREHDDIGAAVAEMEGADD